MSNQNSNKSQKAFWIHCNQCFMNYIQKERKIYILSCYHVACEKCTRVVQQDQVHCPLCKKTTTRRLICNDLHPKLKELFHPRPWMLKFAKTCTILKFQNKQRDHFMVGFTKMDEYCKTLEKERDRIKGELRQDYIIRKKLLDERKKLETLLKKFVKEKTPGLQRMKRSAGNISLQNIGQPKPFKQHEHIHSTYHAHENEYTINFPNESHFSKSFVL